MNIFPSPTQRLDPFDFYAMMRKKHPIEYDEENYMYEFFDIMIYPNVLQISKTFHLILQNGVIAQMLIHPQNFKLLPQLVQV
jgi:hypothetical protein